MGRPRQSPHRAEGIPSRTPESPSTNPSSKPHPVSFLFWTRLRPFLGRPWHQNARVVVMRTYLDFLISPLGWDEWNGSGPASDTSKRVKWPGFHVISNPKEASQFTVTFILAGRTQNSREIMQRSREEHNHPHEQLSPEIEVADMNILQQIISVEERICILIVVWAGFYPTRVCLFGHGP
ncbi:hypothetical protein AHAS_Ahas08G0076300 [Arachis hypogaea]